MWLDNASDIDILFYEPYAKLISDITRDGSKNPLTIGVFGLWGAGKSTLLSLIDKKLNDDPDIICVNINAWMFEGYEDAKVALMESLLKELYDAKPFQEVKENIKKLVGRVNLFKVATSTLSIGASIAASIASGNPLPLLTVPKNVEEAANAIKKGTEVAEKVKTDFFEQETTVDNVRKFRKDFEEMIGNTTVKNVVVIIDDLDRCTPERIIETLEAIKLFLSVKRTTFVIAADEKVIQYAVKKEYPIIDGSDVQLANEYTEKIIQLPIYIPELSSKDIENYLLLLVAQNYLSTDSFSSLIRKIYEKKYTIRDTQMRLEELKEIISELGLNFNPSESSFMKDAVIIDSVRDIVSITLKGNPRQAKRFLNTFVTKQSLAQMYYDEDIDMRILAKILVLQKLDPVLFNQLNEWNKEFKISNERFKEMYEAVLSDSNNPDYARWSTLSVKKWLECEPKELFNQRLDKYFYLTRENLKKNIFDSQNFSFETKQILEKIGNTSEGSISGIMNDMKKLQLTDLNDVFSILIPKVESGQLKYFITKELYVTFESYREKIIQSMSESKQVIKLADTVYLKAMYKIDEEEIAQLLETMKSTGRLTQKLYDQIVRKDK
ncbi:P-loop NTPase fold protein [Enterococcus gallinarum]|uniref:KAP family P-loop NTPase fold protein n=1 Tax=Enterococcus gallinarum TaxID=1353 RepID=UPI0018AA814F|nr:P-loop NTPase fold protein [Enterococcus gallinarum]